MSADARRQLLRVAAVLGSIERAADHTDESPAVDIGDAISGARQLVDNVVTSLESARGRRELDRTMSEFEAWVDTLAPNERDTVQRRMAAEMDRIARKLGLGPPRD